MEANDWLRVRAIYEEGIRTGHATFQTETPSWEVWDQEHLKVPRIVAVDDGVVAGWAALTPVSDRCVYGGVAEVSVYVAEAYRGRGVGGELVKGLIQASEANGIWTLQAGIFPENAASIKAHERSGFRVVGRRERLGKLAGVWRDVMLLERRSRVVSADD